jgi:hypothetical protein
MKKRTFQASPLQIVILVSGFILMTYLFWKESPRRMVVAAPSERAGLHRLVASLIDEKTPVKKSGHFRVHGSAGGGAEVIRRAEHAWFDSNVRGLPEMEKDGLGHIALLNAAEWAVFTGKAEHDSDHRSGQVAHEVIHYRLEDAGLPLWAEEGLALHLGVEITLAFERLIGQRAGESAELPGVRRPVGQAIMDFDRYPEDPAVLAGFYRHCRLFTKALKLDKEQLQVYVHALGRGEAWDGVLADSLQMPPDRIEQLRKLAEITVHVE